MKNRFKYSLIAILLFPILVLAQQINEVDLSNALQVGSKFIPPSSVQVVRGNESTIDWKRLENKVVLLDFFATTCGYCIKVMPHLQELQQQYPDIFKVIIVTTQDKATIEDFFAKNKYLKEHGVNLPVIYSDTYLKERFPYISVPHSVLLYKGMVQAITTAGFINAQNVQQLHKEGSITLPLKNDYGKGDLLTSSLEAGSTIKAGVIFSGFQNGVNYQPWKMEKDSLTGLYKSSMYNTSLYGALLSLASKAKIKESYIPRFDRVVWKVRDTTKYENLLDEPADVWLVEHAISYERYDLVARPDSIQARMIMEDFDGLYGVKAYESTKRMPCLVLKPCPVVPYAGKELGSKMGYTGTKVLAGFLDYINKFPPVVDEANLDIKMRIGAYKTLAELNQQLAAYGANGQIEEREIKVLVIEEVKE